MGFSFTRVFEKVSLAHARSVYTFDALPLAKYSMTHAADSRRADLRVIITP